MWAHGSATDAGLAGWEGERANGIRGSGDAGRLVRCLAPLPPGYSAQEAWGFRDPSGTFSYEFLRVYGPPDADDPHGPTCRLDERRSYWVVIWRAHGTSPDSHPVGRWLTYAQALKLFHGHLTFRRFSSPVDMRDEIPRLLDVAGIVVETEPAAPPHWPKAA